MPQQASGNFKMKINNEQAKMMALSSFCRNGFLSVNKLYKSSFHNTLFYLNKIYFFLHVNCHQILVFCSLIIQIVNEITLFRKTLMSKIIYFNFNKNNSNTYFIRPCSYPYEPRNRFLNRPLNSFFQQKYYSCTFCENLLNYIEIKVDDMLS